MPIADFLRDEKLLANYQDIKSRDFITRFKKYTRQNLEKQAKTFLKKAATSPVDKEKEKQENAVLAALRETEERYGAEKKRMMSQAGTFTAQAEMLKNAVASILKSIQSIKVAEAEEAPAPRRAMPGGLLAGLAGGAAGLKKAQLKKREESSESLSSMASGTTASTSASEASGEDVTSEMKQKLTAAFAKKGTPVSAPKVAKTREEIKREKTSAINAALGEIEFLQSGEIPPVIQRQIEQLMAIEQKLEQYQAIINEKQEQLEGKPVAESAKTQEAPTGRRTLNLNLAAGIAAKAAARGEFKEPVGAQKEEVELSPKEKMAMQLEEKTQLRRLKMEYASDKIFKAMVDKYLQTMQRPFSDAVLEDKIMKGHILGLFKKHSDEIERREKAERAKAEFEARKKAQEREKQKNSEQLQLLHNQGINFTKGSPKELIDNLHTTLAESIAQATKEIEKIPEIIQKLDKAIELKKGSVAPSAAIQKPRTQPQAPLERKRSFTVSPEAAPKSFTEEQKIEKLRVRTNNEYAQFLRDLSMYVQEVQKVNAHLSAPQQAKNIKKLDEVHKKLQPMIKETESKAFKNKTVSHKEVKELVDLTTTTVDVANKIENFRLNTIAGRLLNILSNFIGIIELFYGIRKAPPMQSSIFKDIEHMKNRVIVKAQNLKPSPGEKS